MYHHLRNLRFWLLAFAVSWLVLVIVLIARTPDPGAASADELATGVAEALRTHDTRKLTPLVSVGGEEVARATTERFAGLRVSAARYTEGAVVVDFVRADGTSGTVRMPATETDGRWQLTPLTTP